MGKRKLVRGQTPNQPTINRIVKNVEKLENIAIGATKHAKQKRTSGAPRIGKHLYQWRRDKNIPGIVLNGEFVKFHANYLLEEANALLTDDKEIIVKLFKGWRDSFKKRFNLKFR